MRSRSRALTAIGALAVLVLGLVLRAPRGDLAEWKSDEALLFEMGRAIAREGWRPLLGEHTTDGPRQAVHFLYLFAAPITVLDDPEAVRLEIAFVSSLACALVVLVGARDLGRRTALASGLILATLPDQVHHGRWLWGANLMGPFCVFALLALARTLGTPRGRSAGVLLVLAGFLPLLHYSLVGPALLGGGVVLWAAWKGANRFALALGLVATAALYTPHLMGEIETHFEDTLGALRIVSQGKKAGHGTAASAAELSRLSYPRFALESFRLEAFGEALGPGGTRPESAQAFSGPVDATLDDVLFGAVFLGAGLGAAELARRKKWSGCGTAVAFSLSGWAPFLLTRVPSRDHYAAAIVPAFAVLAGGALAFVSRWKVGRPLAALVLLAVASAGVLETRAALATIDADLQDPQSDYGLSYREKRGACEALLEKELALAEYPPGKHEFPILLEECYRDLLRKDPDKAGRFVWFPVKAVWTDYWDVNVSVPVPRGRVAAAAVALAQEKPQPGEIERVGRLVIATR